MKPRLPAKLASRRISGSLRRERLFAQLDECADKPLVWVQGPAGAGKTTLVSSWLAQGRSAVLWYRVDAGDVDAATFFSFLAQGAANVSRKRRLNLPLLTPEYLPDLPGFAKRFFAHLFDALPPSCALVLDGYEDAPGDALHGLLLWMCSHVQPGQHIVVTSRQAPPPALAHLGAKGVMATVGWADLKLNLPEVQALATVQGLSDDVARALHARCDGWMAGVVLLLAFVRRSGVLHDQADMALREELFPYYAAELFGRSDAPTRALLLRSALMPAFTAAQAQTLAPEADARAVLQALQRSHFFIERSADAEPVYRYHALFREFLQDKARESLPADVLAAVRRESAALLQAQGQGEAALALYAEAGAWPEAALLLCEMAPALLAQGRYASVEAAIQALPVEVVTQIPWLSFWLGIARLPMSPPRARVSLERAFDGFEEGGDRIGGLTACAAILESFMLQWGDLHPADRWGFAMAQLLSEGGDLPLEVEVRALASTSVLMLRGPLHRETTELALYRVQRCMPLVEQPAQRLALAGFAALLHLFSGEWAMADRFAADIEATAQFDDAPPLQRIFWYSLSSTCQCFSGQFERSMSSVFRVRQVSEQTGIRVMQLQAESVGATVAVHLGDLEAAAAHIAVMRQVILPGRLLDEGNLDYQRALVIVARGDFALARGGLMAFHEKSRACGALHFVAQCGIVLAMASIGLNELDRADVEIGQVADYAVAARHAMLGHSAAMISAWIALRRGSREKALDLLRGALRSGREHEFRLVFPWAPAAMLHELGALALQQGVEVDQMRLLIRTARIAAPGLDVLAWPWPIKVRCLGPFGVWLDDAPLHLPGKAPKKPLELLRALTALGASGGVTTAAIEAALWPDLDGAAAHNAFNVALHRLRRLLGNDEAVLLREGRVSLNEHTVWTDVAALEQVAADENAELSRRIERLIDLYRGHFLADGEMAWAYAPRERLRSHWMRACDAVGRRLEQLARWDDAVTLYRRFIEVEPLAEAFHRGLIRCLRQRGDDTEALDAFRRCADLLHRYLGAKPSPSTRALVRELLA